MGGKAATPNGISAPSYFFGGNMINIDRLIAAGVPREIAFEVAWWFAHYGNDSDFERYVREFKNGQRERVNDG